MFYLVSVFRCAFHMVACIGNNIARIVFSLRSYFTVTLAQYTVQKMKFSTEGFFKTKSTVSFGFGNIY